MIFKSIDTFVTLQAVTFVMVNSNQMVLRRPVCEHTVVTLQVVTFVMVNSNQMVLRRPVCEYTVVILQAITFGPLGYNHLLLMNTRILLLNNFSHLNRVAL